MKFPRWRGPRLGTKLMLLGLLLLVVPWFTYQQLVDMERLLIQGQSQAQLLTAEGISTLFNGRDDLFNDLPVTIEDYEALYAYPIEGPLRVDGSRDDWGDAAGRPLLTFGSEDGNTDGDFKLLLGERQDLLYVYLEVVDDSPVYRPPDYLRLDTADHVRLSFIRTDGDDGRIAVLLPGPGISTAYQMDAEWRFAADGAPLNGVQGYAVETAEGFNIELRLPLAMLGSRRYFGVSFVDVDDPASREITRITQTLPKAGKEGFNLVVFRSADVLNIIKGLGYAGARILVIDKQKRVRAETGAYAIDDDELSPRAESPWFRQIGVAFEWVRPYVHELITGQSWENYLTQSGEVLTDEAITKALAGEPDTYRRAIGGGHEVLMALHPIVSEDAILGTVVVEQNIDDILAFQRAALQQVILLSLASLFAVFIALLAFAGRLAWRIGNLRREASAAIDSYGRLKTTELRSEMNSGDEIGELARAVFQHVVEAAPSTIIFSKPCRAPFGTRSTIRSTLSAPACRIWLRRAPMCRTANISRVQNVGCSGSGRLCRTSRTPRAWRIRSRRKRWSWWTSSSCSRTMWQTAA